MADFEIAYQRTIGHEGGYVNDQNDRGKETYKGISRRAHPNSPMWPFIDDTKRKYGLKNINIRLEQNKQVQDCIRTIYKEQYWDVFNLDNCYSQFMANEIFDDAVNRGVTKACILTSATLGMTPVSKPTDALIHNIINYGKV